MCIRDRVPPGETGLVRSHREAGDVDQATGRPELGPEVVLHLSLIHISEPTTHETVLDLVCRLLLEKKKK